VTGSHSTTVSGGATGAHDGEDPSRTVKTLASVPELRGLYARALLPRRTPDLATATLPPVTYRVADVVAEPEHVAAYQRLLGEPVDGTLPAGFVHVLAFPVATALMVRDDFPLRVAGMVHLANAVTVHRAVGADEQLLVEAHAENLRPHRTGTQVDLVTEVSARYGAGDSTEVVWRGVSTYLAKGVHADGAPRADDPTVSATTSTPADDRPTFTPPTPTARWSLDAGTGRRYAAVSGDHNPIHLSALTARAFGFRRAIAHGMYTASRALAQVGPGRGEAFDWTVDFASPVLLPGTVDLAFTRRGDVRGVDAAAPGTAEGGAGYDYVGWDARRSRLHLSGSVVPRR
jgi:acyl dehydratase